MWDTKVFEILDSVSETLKGVERYSSSMSMNEKKELEMVKSLLEKFAILPDTLSINYIKPYKVIKDELDSIKIYYEKNKQMIENKIIALFKLNTIKQ